MIFLIRGKFVADLPPLRPLSEEEQPYHRRKRPSRKSQPESRVLDNPYAYEDLLTSYWPLLVTIASVFPIVYCLCKMWRKIQSKNSSPAPRAVVVVTIERPSQKRKFMITKKEIRLSCLRYLPKSRLSIWTVTFLLSSTFEYRSYRRVVSDVFSNSGTLQCLISNASIFHIFFLPSFSKVPTDAVRTPPFDNSDRRFSRPKWHLLLRTLGSRFIFLLLALRLYLY